MKRTTKYVAFDVHQANTVAAVREESGRVIGRSILPTHGPTIVEFLQGMRGAIHHHNATHRSPLAQRDAQCCTFKVDAKQHPVS